MLSLLRQLVEWPVLSGSNWNSSAFDLQRQLALISVLNDESILLRLVVFPDPKHSEVNIIQVGLDFSIPTLSLYCECLSYFSALIDSRGLNPAFTLLEEFGGWPVVNGSNWDETSFDLVKLLAKLRLYNNKILIEQWVGSDDKQSDTNIIQVRIF